MDSSNPDLTRISHQLARAAFDVASKDGSIRAVRRRSLPSRGVLRLLVPRVVCRVTPTPGEPEVRVRPDAIAIVMIVVCLGGTSMEAFTDRAEYPREYPPAFVYGLSLGYFALFVLEWFMSRAAVRRALDTKL